MTEWSSVMSEEEAAGYENQYGLKERHQKFLEIMVRFDSFCRKNGIHYSLSDGTLIGAVRHQGFIPWDDDADLLITRDEYNKLRERIRDEKEILLFRIGVLDRITIPEMLDEHVYVDLFILDEVPSFRLKFHLLKAKCGFYRCYFLNIYQLGNSAHQGGARKIIEPILYRLARIQVGKRDVFDLYDSLFSRPVRHDSMTKFTAFIDDMRLRFPKRLFEEAGYTDTMFNGRKLMIIKDTDTVLREMYGDYLSLPPEDRRKPEHCIDMMNAPTDCIRWYNKAQ